MHHGVVVAQFAYRLSHVDELLPVEVVVRQEKVLDVSCVDATTILERDALLVIRLRRLKILQSRFLDETSSTHSSVTIDGLGTAKRLCYVVLCRRPP